MKARQGKTRRRACPIIRTPIIRTPNRPADFPTGLWNSLECSVAVFATVGFHNTGMLVLAYLRGSPSVENPEPFSRIFPHFPPTSGGSDFQLTALLWNLFMFL